MFWYSASLTIIVLVSIPMYALVSLFFTPILQRRLEHKFNVGAENQSFLVETVSAVQTVKSMAIEPRWQQRWDGQLAAYVVASLSTQNVANLAGNSISLINKFATIAIVFFGSIRVTNGDMKVGELIAFNMLASQISTPILRLSQLWNDFQQVGISMSRMSDILDARTETAGKSISVPALTGIILFENVSFRYKPDNADILKEVNLLIQPGEVIGIVGRSGSGKSTLTKLIQRLYLPTEGRVLVDGQDLALMDTVGLRRQVGVVLQENMLFNRSIRDNISVADSAVDLEKIIEVAKLAGAHEFICDLPNGYDTIVGEHGAGLSGGQRQRITIARTLIRDPRILILDEATSALDYESEKIIQDNMQRICQGRTVIIIAHRLSAVRTADRIVVMDRGKITQLGTHEDLMMDSAGIYYQLHSLQHV
jgi:subfamily B ATP-binding cassette protein HlyB/CyaB